MQVNEIGRREDLHEDLTPEKPFRLYKSHRQGFGKREQSRKVIKKYVDT